MRYFIFLFQLMLSKLAVDCTAHLNLDQPHFKCSGATRGPKLLAWRVLPYSTVSFHR